MHQFFQLVVSIVPDEASPCIPLAISIDIPHAILQGRKSIVREGYINYGEKKKEDNEWCLEKPLFIRRMGCFAKFFLK